RASAPTDALRHAAASDDRRRHGHLPHESPGPFVRECGALRAPRNIRADLESHPALPQPRLCRAEKENPLSAALGGSNLRVRPRGPFESRGMLFSAANLAYARKIAIASFCCW